MNYWKGKSYHIHAAIGIAVSVVCWLRHIHPVDAIWIAGAIGLAHEIGDNCFNKKVKPEAPVSGILDTLSFQLSPLAVWIYWLVRA